MAKKDYDSNFCGTLPLHHLNHVQDYGFLLVCSPSLQILQASENCAHFLGQNKEEVINAPLLNMLTPESAERLLQKLNTKGTNKISQAVTFVSGKDFMVLCHIKDGYLLMECEPYIKEKSNGLSDAYLKINEASASIQQAPNLEVALDIAAQELKNFSGFDKVMIYRFDEDWNGHVLAEAMEPDMESYFGITFPASDIPKQARDLYLKNPYRQIPDREYVPAKMYPVLSPVNNGFIDMSDCNLRGIVTVHLEYLANMRVKSSMSTRIIKDNRLWGLIACHHKEKKFMSFDECSVFEFLSSIISSKLSSLETQQHLNDANRSQALYNKIVEDIYAESSLENAVRKSADSLLQLLDATGLAYSSGSKISSYGECPATSSIHELVIWLESKKLLNVYATANLLDVFEDLSGNPLLASGLIALPIMPSRGEFVILFRKEILKSIDWGGNPNEVILFEEDMKTYHPRHSFKVWREEVKNSSTPFTKYELDVAKDLLRILTETRMKELNQH